MSYQVKYSHFLSKCYINQWLPNGQSNGPLWEWKESLEKFKYRRKAFPNHAYVKEKYLYKLKTGKDNEDSLENKFGRIETKLGVIFKKLSDGNTTSELDNAILLHFVITTRQRTPYMIDKVKSFKHFDLFNTIFKKNLWKVGLGNFSQNIHFINSNKLEEEIENSALLSTSDGLLSPQNQEFLRKHFGRKSKISVLNVKNSDFELLCSNFPIIFGTHLFSANKHSLIFPVTPNHILFVAHEEDQEAFYNLMRTLRPVDFIIRTNHTLLHNVKHSPLKNYQIFGRKNDLSSYLPDDIIEKFFIAAN